MLRSFSSVAHLRMNGFPSNPTINPTFLNPTGQAGSLIDLTGVGWNVEDVTKQFTLVSPRHFVGANHFRPGVGQTVRFLAKDNSVHTFTIGNLYTVPNADGTASDVFLGEFTTELPSSVSVNPLPYLNLATEAAYVGEALVIAGKNARGGRGVLESVTDFGQDPVTSGTNIRTRAFTFSYAVAAGFVDDCFAEVGDSGAPSFAVRSGKAALVGTHTAVLNAVNTTTTYDTLVPHYVPRLNELMEVTGLRMKKISPPLTSFAASAAPLDSAIRAGEPFALRITLTNGSAIADNVVTELSQQAGATVTSIARSDWYSTAVHSQRRGGMNVGQSLQFDVNFAGVPTAGTVQISLSVSSDGSGSQNFQFPVTIRPSFGEFSAGLTDMSSIGDSDGDGISNLIEYASGGDPRSASRYFPNSAEMLLPTFTNVPKRLIFIRRTDAGARGLNYVIESSASLLPDAWQLVNAPISLISNPAAGFEKVEATLPSGMADKSFYRLRIELAE